MKLRPGGGGGAPALLSFQGAAVASLALLATSVAVYGLLLRSEQPFAGLAGLAGGAGGDGGGGDDDDATTAVLVVSDGSWDAGTAAAVAVADSDIVDFNGSSDSDEADGADDADGVEAAAAVAGDGRAASRQASSRQEAEEDADGGALVAENVGSAGEAGPARRIRTSPPPLYSGGDKEASTEAAVASPGAERVGPAVAGKAVASEVRGGGNSRQRRSRGRRRRRAAAAVSAGQPPAGPSPARDAVVDLTPLPQDCDLFVGRWVEEKASAPSYTDATCSFISAHQNCRANGRPDRGYEQWRWRPSRCELPRFDGRRFLAAMAGRSILFVGDSVARNHMESLLCLLSQVEQPINRGNRKYQRYLFRSTGTFVLRVWSSWLVHEEIDSLDGTPESLVKLHVDRVDERFADLLPQVAVTVLCSGHWWVKPAAFVCNGTVVGAVGWRPPPNSTLAAPGRLPLSNTEAFSEALATALGAALGAPGYAGLTVLRTFSPDHYEGGEWNTGGACASRTAPLAPDEHWPNTFTDDMRARQLAAAARASEVARGGGKGGSRLAVMDVTPSSEGRADGHPGPYRSTDPAAKAAAKAAAEAGKPLPQDCLHWCMPGPIDTWNEFLLEMILRDVAVTSSTA